MGLTETFARLGRYGLTGGVAAVVNVGALALLTPRLLPVPAAAACAFAVAALVNYGLTSRFVFRQPFGLRRMATFLAFALVGLTVNVGVTSVGALRLGLPVVSANVAGIGVAFFVNFWLNSAIVFRRRAGS